MTTSYAFTSRAVRRSGGQPRTVIADCVGRLRSDIMNGVLRPGQKLVEADLCDQMVVSRPSLREALRVLEADRLIELVPHHGPSVARLGAREIEEIHDVWSMLTGEGVYRFAEVASARDVAGLNRAVARLKSAARLDDHLAMLAVTNAIFNAILIKCGNGLLIEMVYSLVSRINFLRAQSLLDKEWRYRCVGEIEAMIGAIRADRPAAARRAVRDHISSACETAKQVMLVPKRRPGRAAGISHARPARGRRSAGRLATAPAR